MPEMISGAVQNCSVPFMGPTFIKFFPEPLSVAARSCNKVPDLVTGVPGIHLGPPSHCYTLITATCIYITVTLLEVVN